MTRADEAARVAERLLSPLGRRWGHVQGVATTAAALTSGLSADDADTLVAAAWLHDIGYAPELVDTGFHPLDGARWLIGQGYETELVALVSYHSGAQVEAEERGLRDELADLPTPSAELLARVTAADMSTGPDGDPVVARDRIAEILSRYPEDDPVHRAVSRSGPELVATTERVLLSLGVTVDGLAAAR